MTDCNPLQRSMYTALVNLCNADKSFYFSDRVLGDDTFRIFDYRMANYTQWLHPYALECRGTTFLINYAEEPLALVSWPFNKFFNLNECPTDTGVLQERLIELGLLNENPEEMRALHDNFVLSFGIEELRDDNFPHLSPIDWNETQYIMDKRDGSLISSMFIRSTGGIHLKSKGALTSDQANAANILIRTDKYAPLLKFVEHMALVEDVTVIMEYTAPDNRIVLPYAEAELFILGLRNNHTGDYERMEYWTNKHQYAEPFFVKNLLNAGTITNVSEFVESINDMTGIEGFVIMTDTGIVKIKTEWYCILHHIKDSINSPRRLFEACVFETVDDVRSQFHDDEVALAKIAAMEDMVQDAYFKMSETVNAFFETNKDLTQKDYAIKGQKELPKMYFSLAMPMFHGKEVDYRAYMAKHYKEFGVQDDEA